MARIKFTSALSRFFPSLTDMEVHETSVREVIQKVDVSHPGIQDYLLEEDGSLRKHVNIFIDDEMINDRVSLSDSIDDSNEILVFQALSGG